MIILITWVGGQNWAKVDNVLCEHSLTQHEIIIRIVISDVSGSITPPLR